MLIYLWTWPTTVLTDRSSGLRLGRQ